MKVLVDVSDFDKVVKNLQKADVEKLQPIFANEVMRIADDYVPFATGVLKGSATLSPDFSELSYNTPYARYMYLGNLMVDPITLKGSFYDPVSGRHWSRPLTPKILDPNGRTLDYNGAPKRGSHWIERAVEENKKRLVNTLVKAIKKII